MLSFDQQRLVEHATVTLPGQGGQGVLIPGNLILTAAHCVTWTADGSMVLGDFFGEAVRTAQGQTLTARPVFLDLLSDIALLGAIDNDAMVDERDAYVDWCEQITPITLYEGDFPFNRPTPIAVYTHRRQWISGTVQQMRYESPSLACVWDTPIEGGTSGSPLLTMDGRIAEVVSTATHENPEGMSSAPRPHLTLPVWALRQIQVDDTVHVARMAWYGFPAIG